MTCHVARRVRAFARRLRHDRREVFHALVTTDVELTGCERHYPGDFLDDAATDTACRLLASLEERDRRELAEIEAAEERLCTETFGRCDACARPLPLSRLRALPTARLCVACEQTVERTLSR